MIAMFWGPWLVLSLDRSSWKTTSKTQCSLFSMCQWALAALAIWAAPAASEAI